MKRNPLNPVLVKWLVLGAGAIAAGVLSQIEPPIPRRKKIRLQLSGMAVDRADEPEPEGIFYDNRPPCRAVESVEGGQVLFADEEGGECTPPWELEPKKRTSAPFAEGGPRPLFPLQSTDDQKLLVSYQDVRNFWHGKWGRHFGTSRSGDDGLKRLHSGIDLFGDEGDIVRSMEDGEILAALPFHHGTFAVYVLNDSGIIVNYGEVDPQSLDEFDIQRGTDTGQRVTAGQPIARVGKMREESMLHLETYSEAATLDDIRQGKLRWPRNESAPPNLLDPSRYLVRAQRVAYEDKEA